jgi:hypothetical protein
MLRPVVENLTTLTATNPVLQSSQPPHNPDAVKVASTAALLRVLSDFTSSTGVVFSGLYEATCEAQNRITDLSKRCFPSNRHVDVFVPFISCCLWLFTMLSIQLSTNEAEFCCVLRKIAG